MTLVCGSDYIDRGPSLEVDLGAGTPGRIDGTIENEIAVEIESRGSGTLRRLKKMVSLRQVVIAARSALQVAHQARCILAETDTVGGEIVVACNNEFYALRFSTRAPVGHEARHLGRSRPQLS